MNILKAVIGWALILWTLLDAFEQVILPRNEARPFRLSQLAFRVTWGPWKALARRIRSEERRTNFLAYYGPLSVLIMLSFWDLALIFGFSLGWREHRACMPRPGLKRLVGFCIVANRGCEVCW